MTQTGINLQSVKTNNRSAILRLLNTRGPMSRKDIAAELGLTPASVTQICNEMILLDILTELGEMQETKRAGRRKILIGINYKVRYVLSITIEINGACISVSDMQGDEVSTRHLPLDLSISPEEYLRQLAGESKILMWEKGIPREKVLGVGVAMPGAVDRVNGVPLQANRIWEHKVEVGPILSAELGFPVILENNVKAYAEAGLTYSRGLNGQRENFLFLKWGPGVGSAVIIHGQIYEGRYTKAAEIGHIRVIKENGKRCRCGRAGCLETVASTHEMAETIREACTPQTMPKLYQLVEGNIEQIQARNISWWIQSEDEGMWQLLDKAVAQLAYVVCATTTVLAPDRVILYGRMFQLPHFKEKFLHACKAYDAAYDESLLTMSKLQNKIDYIGPLAVVVNELFLSGKSLENPVGAE